MNRLRRRAMAQRVGAGACALGALCLSGIFSPGIDLDTRLTVGLIFVFFLGMTWALLHLANANADKAARLRQARVLRGEEPSTKLLAGSSLLVSYVGTQGS